MDWLKSSENNTKCCKKDKLQCLKQVVIDGLVFVAIFAMLTHMVDNRDVDPTSLMKFFGLYVPTVFALRILDLEYADQFARVAGWSLAAKLFGVMEGAL